MEETPVRFRGPYVNYVDGTNFIVLQETNGIRSCYITVDPFIAQVMYYEINKQTTPRPLTHRLFINTLNDLKLILEKVVVTKVVDTIFHALLCIRDKNNSVTEIDSRPSDAITLALIKGCSILVNDSLLETDEKLIKDLEQVEKNEASSTIDARSEMMTDEEAMELLKKIDENKIKKH